MFAYGQTGTGKTFSMGTCNQPVQAGNNQSGIIPRAVNQIFDADPDLKVKVSSLSYNVWLISVSFCIVLPMSFFLHWVYFHLSDERNNG